MTIISSTLLRSTGLVTVGMSTRNGGVSRKQFGLNLSFSVGDAEADVQKNRELFLGQMGVSSTQLALPRQVHSNVVKYVSTPGLYPDCDGLVTDVPEICLGISVADCVPVLVLDTERKAIAAIHAGWRGTVGKIVQQGLQLMIDQLGCNPEHIMAYIGPCAGECCYIVGAEVAAQLPPDCVRANGKDLFVDLKTANKIQLLKMGVAANAIEVSPHCTICEDALFHSYRRDKELSGRMMAAIRLGA